MLLLGQINLRPAIVAVVLFGAVTNNQESSAVRLRSRSLAWTRPHVVTRASSIRRAAEPVEDIEQLEIDLYLRRAFHDKCI